MIQQQLPDLVLTDVMMPEMDGFQLLSALRANPITQSIPIILQLEPVDSGVQITISDTGISIHPDFLPSVFDRFSQAEVPSCHTPGGVGLGLAIAR